MNIIFHRRIHQLLNSPLLHKIHREKYITVLETCHNLVLILVASTLIKDFLFGKSFFYMYLIFLTASSQGVTKRCRLSLLTNSSLVYESKCGGIGVLPGLNEYSCGHHVTWSPNKLWRSTSLFNLCFQSNYTC
jgi:hypothetical protein